MEVYTAEARIAYEGFIIIGIYDDIDKAKKACEDHAKEATKDGFDNWHTYNQSVFYINETDI